PASSWGYKEEVEVLASEIGHGIGLGGGGSSGYDIPIINRQWTFIVGRKPTDKEKDWYKRVVDRISAIIEEIKPGKTTADAAKHFPPASSWGYKEEVEVLASEIGHGIGLGGGGSSGYDIPIINRQWSFKFPQVFEEGMTIAVESREGETRAGGVRLENMLVVTKDGAEIMDHFPRDEIQVAPR
ncbi:MAG: M24 family metallopeptidase, partial [Candidatus Binatota bacterium]